MPNESEEDERLRLLNEMRAYGKATPFAHTAPAAPGKRENVYDASMREWMASRTFKWLFGLACVLPAVLMCLYFVLVVGAVGWGGAVILNDINRILGGY